MSSQNSGQLEQGIFNQMAVVGGPPIPEIIALQVTGCTGGDFDLYNQVQRAIDCTIASEGPENVTSLGRASVQSDINDRPPFSCMRELLTGQYSECGMEIPSNLRRDAYEAFSEVTGYKPINLSQVFDYLN